MDLYAQLEREHSKFNTSKIVDFVGADETRFAELMRIFFEGPYRLTQRAAWPMSYCVENHPFLIKPYLGKLIAGLGPEASVAVKRNSLRLLQNVEIPKNLRGQAVSVCFRFLEDRSEPVAVKVFAMTVIYHIASKESDLLHELKLILEDQWPIATPGFRSRAGKILKNISPKSQSTK